MEYEIIIRRRIRRERKKIKLRRKWTGERRRILFGTGFKPHLVNTKLPGQQTRGDLSRGKTGRNSE
jgi:hypothetical protein